MPPAFVDTVEDLIVKHVCLMGIRLTAACGLGLMLATDVSAQTAPDFRQFFSVSTPGARANAMGGAFIGVADDATAAITNPSGLMFLTRTQVYFEVKGPNRHIDAFGDLVGSPAGLSFLGVSTPVNDRVAVGFVRHEFFNYEDEAWGFSARGVSYGGSVATTVTPDVNVGVTLASHDDGFGNKSFGAIFGGLWRASDQVTVGVSGGKSDNYVMPARFGAGVGYRPVPRGLIAVDVAWLGYGQTGWLGGNATEVHVGGEYELLARGQNRLFGRAGFFTVSTENDGAFFDEDRFHRNVATIGAGLTVGLRFQVDAAVLTNGDAIVSAGIRF